MKTMLMAAVMLSVFDFPDDALVGRWESLPSEKGNKTGVVFKEDKSFEGYVNRKPFVSGNYTFSAADSILSFIDNGCQGMQGVYKVRFFHTGDSLRFQALVDNCPERKQGMERLVMGRVK